MTGQKQTKKTCRSTSWLGWIRPLLTLGVLLAFALSNRERILDKVRHFNKRYLNPRMLRIAERHQVYYAVLEHTGRRSGQAYTTPVVADFSTDRTFLLIPLPYGVATDWCRNVVAAGRCTLRMHGVTYTVVEPQIVDAGAALPQLRVGERVKWRIFGIANFLRVRIAEPMKVEHQKEQVGLLQPRGAA